MFREAIHYLGYVVSSEGIAPESDKVDKIKKWPFPPTGNDMLVFLWLVGYYRKLIPNLADLEAPLYKVAQEKRIQRTPELEQSFQILKEIACKIPP